MTHDPLCPNRNVKEWQPCAPCDLISAVRADERRRYVAGLDRIIREVDTAERHLNHLLNPTGYDPATTDIRP